MAEQSLFYQPVRVLIYCQTEAGAEELAREVLWGLEEEGVPGILVAQEGSAHELAAQGAEASPLGVGVGIGKDGTMVLTHQRIRSGGGLMVLEGTKSDPEGARMLGVNAGRLVKGQPLVWYEPSFNEIQKEQPAFDDDVVRTVVQAVRQVISRN